MSYTFDDYQEACKKTAKYPVIEKSFVYPVLGLVGESGEVAEKIKKIFRDGDGTLNEEQLEMLKKEIGDVLWYVAQLSTELGLSMSDVAKTNINKLQSRLERDKIHGSGDDR